MPWACFMTLRALYVSKLAKYPLICLADLAGDQQRAHLQPTSQLPWSILLQAGIAADNAGCTRQYHASTGLYAK
jgi:hypothetical protein